MQHSFEEELDPKQVQLTPEQAKAILERHSLQQLDAASSPTLADMAEALGISEAEALRLWQGMEHPTRIEPTERKRVFTPLLGLLLVALITVVVLVSWAWSAARGTPAAYQPPPQAQDIWQRSALPAGFSVSIIHDQGGVEYPPSHAVPIEELATKDQVQLRNRVERAIPAMIEEELSRHSPLERPEVSVKVGTENGSVTFGVRTFASAFPLTNNNSSTTKLKEDIHRELAKGWSALVPPNKVKKQSQR